MMKLKKHSLTLLKVAAPAVLCAMALAAPHSAAPSLERFLNPVVKNANGGYASPSYATQADAQQAAIDLNIQLTGEGSVLLKNKDNALPLAKATEKVTVFGSAQGSLQGGQGNVRGVLADDGFVVNATIINENSLPKDDEEISAALGEFTDVAVILLKRGGGEGSDLSIKTNEAANDAEENNGWAHKALATDAEGKAFKHNQMLTKAELEMIELAKKKCTKVVVLLNTSNAMEMFNLQNDPNIDSIMFIGRPGNNGLKAVPKLLSGEMNPSGKLADTWDKDFSANPTWYNSLANAQNQAQTNTYITPDGKKASKIELHGVDYSEDIYLGYKYSETVYEEIRSGNLSYTNGVLAVGTGSQEQADAWYADNVVYPFGSGLSYTSFEIGAPQIDHAILKASQVNSSLGAPAEVKTVKVSVKVTNTGEVAGKEVVEIYNKAPYTRGGIEKAAVSLVGYGKTGLLAPGASETLEIEVNLQDLASYDYKDANDNGFVGYELEAGKYDLIAANTSHCSASNNKATLEIAADSTLALDDFSDNLISNVFSSGRSQSLRTNDNDWNGDGVIDSEDKMFTEEQVLLSRKDMVATMPKGNKTTVVEGVYSGGYVVTKEFADLMDYYASYNLNYWKETIPYFSITKEDGYKKDEKFGLAGTKKVFQATKDQPAIKELTMDGVFETIGEHVYYNNVIYRVTKALDTLNFTVEEKNVASKDYAVGDFVSFPSVNGWTGAVTINNVRITKAVTAGTQFNTRSNCQNVNPSMRLVTSGEEANVVVVQPADYIALFASEIDEQNSGDYVYSDKIFTDDVNGYLGFNNGYDVTAEMLEGWSQMPSSAAQKEAIDAKPDEWIWFTDMNGIDFFAEEYVIESGKFAGKTNKEAWIEFMNEWTWDDIALACWQGGNNGSRVENLGIPWGGIQDSPTSFWGTYSWCCNTTIAQTWNTELGYEQGAVVASLALFKKAQSGHINNNYNGTRSTTTGDEWLNPAINTHRTPFSGRNNEYYSSDGYHAGKFAAAVVKGIQDRGVSSHLKHMFLNDQETNRNSGDLFAWVSEQAIREVYIKPFQMAIQEGGAEGAMSAFARIGAVPTPVSGAMCNALVHEEWGSAGFMFHPDMYSPQSNVSPEDLMLRTGHFHAPGGNNANTQAGVVDNKTYSGKWDANYDNPLTGEKGGVYIGKDDEATGQERYYSNNQWYIVRFGAMLMYNEYANNSHALNGLKAYLTTDSGSFYGFTAGVAATIDLQGIAGAGHLLSNFSATGLPEGLVLSESGVITGTVAEAGVHDVTVSFTADGWIPMTVNIKIQVVPAGVVVINVEINEDGDLIVTYSDGTTK
ncbi:MAG: glycoside hydrolase family 3 protein, partial [Bacilli bacterium]|nr:glycoside hydrolase family 3 protein [Bacilli bacterium]